MIVILYFIRFGRKDKNQYETSHEGSYLTVTCRPKFLCHDCRSERNVTLRVSSRPTAKHRTYFLPKVHLLDTEDW